MGAQKPADNDALLLRFPDVYVCVRVCVCYAACACSLSIHLSIHPSFHVYLAECMRVHSVH